MSHITHSFLTQFRVLCWFVAWAASLSSRTWPSSRLTQGRPWRPRCSSHSQGHQQRPSRYHSHSGWGLACPLVGRRGWLCIQGVSAGLLMSRVCVCVRVVAVCCLFVPSHTRSTLPGTTLCVPRVCTIQPCARTVLITMAPFPPLCCTIHNPTASFVTAHQHPAGYEARRQRAVAEAEAAVMGECTFAPRINTHHKSRQQRVAELLGEQQ